MNFQKIKNRFGFYRAFLWEVILQLIIPIALGIVALVATSGIKQSSLSPTVILSNIDATDLIVGISVTLGSYLLLLVSTKEWESFQGLSQGLQIRKTFQILAPYAHLVSMHLNLPGKMGTLFSMIINEINQKGGGFAVLKVDDDHYMNYLTEALRHTEISFNAILTKQYPPHWFFEEPKSAEKLSYLELVNKEVKKRSLLARRIMILEESTLKESFGKLALAQRKKFFDLNSNVELYWIGSDTLAGFADFQPFMSSVEEDYALFDDALVLKKNLTNQLTVFLGSQNQGYREMFSDRLWKIHRARFQTKEQLKKSFLNASVGTV